MPKKNGSQLGKKTLYDAEKQNINHVEKKKFLFSHFETLKLNGDGG